jgi:geranylgeranyl pyrophosphate synthase
MVFQLTDDVLDLLATEEFLGKPAGSDIREGTFTLPVIYALRGKEGDRVRRLLEGGKPYPADAVEEVIGLVQRGGHLEHVLDETERRMAGADAAIAELPDGEVTRVLRALGEFLVARVDQAREG